MTSKSHQLPLLSLNCQGVAPTTGGDTLATCRGCALTVQPRLAPRYFPQVQMGSCLCPHCIAERDGARQAKRKITRIRNFLQILPNLRKYHLGRPIICL